MTGKKFHRRIFFENEEFVYRIITQGCTTLLYSEGITEPVLENPDKYLRDIQHAIDNDWREMDRQKGLAKYISESSLKSVVISIPEPQVVRDNTGTFGTFLLHWNVICSEKLTPIQEKKLVDYIEGQNSDGWGEGFEQIAIDSWKESLDYEDDDEGWDRVTVELYAHPWYIPSSTGSTYPKKRMKPTITLISG